MQGYMQQQEVQNLLGAALECSFYVSPKEPGLTYDELLDFGNKVSLQPGEIGDAIPNITTQYFGRATGRLLPNKHAMSLWHLFMFREEPDFRSVEAFDFLYAQFDASARAHGRANAKLKHSEIVKSAVAQGIKETDIEVAVAIVIFTEQFIEEQGILRSLHPQAPFQSPSQALRQQNVINRIIKRPERARAYPIVKEIIEHRAGIDLPRPAQAAKTTLSVSGSDKNPKQVERVMVAARKVFIGHGRSPAWRELKDFLEDRLRLSIEEFNSVSTAGIPTAVRLAEMLDSVAFAFLVMTAEDAQPSGVVHARLNVIHEAGLFQGRLGFAKAIILLEEGCEGFSNIDGLGQIRFSKDNIKGAFDQVRHVLERENIIVTL